MNLDQYHRLLAMHIEEEDRLRRDLAAAHEALWAGRNHDRKIFVFALVAFTTLAIVLCKWGW